MVAEVFEMELTIKKENIRSFLNVVDAVLSIKKDCWFFVGKNEKDEIDGLHLSCISEDEVQFFNSLLKDNLFAKIVYPKEPLLINLEEFRNIVDKDGIEELHLQIVENELVVNEKSKSSIGGFKMKVVAEEFKERFPKLVSFECSVNCACKDLESKMLLVKKSSDVAKFECNNKILRIEASGVNKERFVELNSSFGKFDCKVEPVIAKFNLEKFGSFFDRCSKLSDNVIFSYGNDYPMKISISNDCYKVNYIIAPILTDTSSV